MELRQLKIFVVLAECLNFSQASEILGLSQSSVSKYIKALENEMDVELINRERKRIKLTLPGEVFLEEAKKILLISEQVPTVLDQPLSQKIIKLGILPLSALTFLPDFINYVTKNLPSVKFEVITYKDNNLAISDLREGILDLIFFNQTSPWQDIETLEVFEDDIVAIAAAHTELAKKTEITIQDLPHLKYILPPTEANPYLLNIFFNTCITFGFTPNIAFQIDPHQSRLSLVAAGLGTALDAASLEVVKVPNLVFIPFEEKIRTKTKILMGWKSSSKYLLTIQEFIEYFEARRSN